MKKFSPVFIALLALGSSASAVPRMGADFSPAQCHWILFQNAESLSIAMGIDASQTRRLIDLARRSCGPEDSRPASFAPRNKGGPSPWQNRFANILSRIDAKYPNRFFDNGPSETSQAIPPPPQEPRKTVYRCPMHHSVTSDKPGKCPICGMELEKVDDNDSDDGSTHPHPAPMTGALGPYEMNRDGSGTSWVPNASTMGGMHARAGNWGFMGHGFVNSAVDRAGGPRGDLGWMSTSMFMFSAQRPLGPGSFTARAMFSADPLLDPKGYPLLFQMSGPQYQDRKDPHGLFMELALIGSLRLAAHAALFGYFGNPGEPALGPAVFFHRGSGEDFPQAPIGHDSLDATHDSPGVATLGAVLGAFKVDASLFNARDCGHFQVCAPRFDSNAYRLTWNRGSHWSFQASRGRLKTSEGDGPAIVTNRTTASASYAGTLKSRTLLATAAYARNDEHPGQGFNAYLFELSADVARKTRALLRAERVDKDDLIPDGQPLAGTRFTVHSVSSGVSREIGDLGPVRTSVGALVSVSPVPSALQPAYGKAPVSFIVWFKAKWPR